MMQHETEHTVSAGGLQSWLGRRRQESECAGDEESVAQDAVTIFVSVGTTQTGPLSPPQLTVARSANSAPNRKYLAGCQTIQPVWLSLTSAAEERK
jgi:hypothetical protein